MQIANYSFTALRGIQAGREYYVVMIPLKLIPKIFLFQEDEIPPQLRAQRVLNKARIPEIAKYLIKNKTDYVFSSLTASIDGETSFRNLEFNGNRLSDIGILEISMDSRFLINDGQHRRAAIEVALKESPSIGNETISVVFFIDIGLRRSQQMFADLNKHAIKPTKSIGILYDHRDPLSLLAKKVVDEIPVFSKLTEMEKTSISNRSTKLFTLSSIYQGNIELLKKKRNDKISKEEEALVIDYWKNVVKYIPDWILAAEKKVSTSELRKEYIHAHALAIQAIGKLGAFIISYNLNYKEKLKQLKNVDWSRSNASIWEGRAMINGRINKTHNFVTLTTNYLKKIIGIDLTSEEEKLEIEYLRKV